VPSLLESTPVADVFAARQRLWRGVFRAGGRVAGVGGAFGATETEVAGASVDPARLPLGTGQVPDRLAFPRCESTTATAED
jgi:hypothetical protein